MHWNTFSRSALFAALAAAAWLPWVMITSPVFGVWNARAFYLVGTMALYVARLSAGAPLGLALAAMAAGLGGVLAMAVHSTTELALGLAAIVGVVRGAFLYRSAPARAAVIEVALIGGGLLFARFLAATSVFPTAFALWGFLLVQSFFFLIPGARRRQSKRRGDPFEEAYRSAVAILDR